MKKLKGIYLDDDTILLEMIKDISANSPFLEISQTFSSPSDFLEALPYLECDVYLIDIYMPEISGLKVAQRMGSRPFMFITGEETALKEALALNPIDIVTKPVSADRFNKAAQKAYDLINCTKNKTGRAEFSTVEKGKIIICLGNIMFVTTDENDGRNKKFYMQNGEIYTAKRCNIEQLLDSTEDLIQVNKREAVSLNAVETVEHDVVTLKGILEHGKPKQITLGKTFVKELKERLELIRL